jgi:DNA-binding NarL/FixJ family response regulator
MVSLSALLVDDNTTFLGILRNYLKERQWENLVSVVGTATNGEDALEKASVLKPQVVLLDLVMPGLSGLQVIPRLKTLLPQTKIIVLTLLDSPDYSKASLEGGADYFVAKENLDVDLRPVFTQILQNINSQATSATKNITLP